MKKRARMGQKMPELANSPWQQGKALDTLFFQPFEHS